MFVLHEKQAFFKCLNKCKIVLNLLQLNCDEFVGQLNGFCFGFAKVDYLKPIAHLEILFDSSIDSPCIRKCSLLRFPSQHFNNFDPRIRSSCKHFHVASYFIFKISSMTEICVPLESEKFQNINTNKYTCKHHHAKQYH